YTSGVFAQQALIKIFKFFDLSNSGFLCKNQFFRGLAKLGVVPQIQDTDKIFACFDKNETEKIDYKEFVQNIMQISDFSNIIPDKISKQYFFIKIFKYKKSCKKQENIGYQKNKLPKNYQQVCQQFCQKVQQILKQRGLASLLGLGIMFKSMTLNGKKQINQDQFENAIREYKIYEEADVLNQVFQFFDKHDNGLINYEDFLNYIKMPYNNYRTSLVTQIFNQLDRANVGVINNYLIKSSFNPQAHPDVLQNKKSQEDVNLEFRSCFESYLDYRVKKKKIILYQQKTKIKDILDDKMTMEDFLDFYSFQIHHWLKDEDFKNYIISVWRQDSYQKSVCKQQQQQQQYQQQQFSPAFQNNSPARKSLLQLNNTENQSIQSQKRQMQNQEQQLNKEALSQLSKQQYSRNSKYKNNEDTISIASQASQATNSKYMRDNNVSERQLELILIRIKNRLASRGAKGFLQMERIFKVFLKNYFIFKYLKQKKQIADTDDDGRVNLNEFKKCIRDSRIDVTDSEINISFNLFDPEESGTINFFDFLNTLKGQMNEFRFNIVDSIFAKIDYNNTGIVTIQDIQRQFNARAHPDVKTTKKHEDEVYQDFFANLELHNKLYVFFFLFFFINLKQKSGVVNQEISKEQFFDYFNNYSASIQDDQFFETILVNTFKLSQQNQLTSKYAGHRNMFDPLKKGFLQDHHRYLINGGSVSSNAPYGTFQEPTDYATQQRPYSTQSRQSPVRQKSQQQYQNSSNALSECQDEIDPLEELKKKLNQRGIRGYLKLYSKLKSAYNQKKISSSVFAQCLQEQRIQCNECEFIFQKYSNQQGFDLDSFFKDLKGKIKEQRQALIVYAFQIMDNNRCGEVQLDDVLQNYNCQEHPYVKIGKLTEDEVLVDFQDSFESHLTIFNQSNLNKGKVHFNEFFEFYHIISATIDDDQFFEDMMVNCWNIQL
ncbi:hypothetical protein IMG5_151930, partial [Ichthyophthirius multifiliis]